MAKKEKEIKLKDETARFDPEEIQKHKVVCAVCYSFGLFFLPLIFCKGSSYGKFHANQALSLLIANVIIIVINRYFVPFVGALAAYSIWDGDAAQTAYHLIITISNIVLGTIIPISGVLYGVINTAKGKAMRLPIIGKNKAFKDAI